MKKVQKQFVFIAKSMLWSLLLYAAFMLAFNWDDVSNRVRGVNPVTVVNNIQPGQGAGNNPVTVPATISGDAGIINGLLNVLKGLGNVADRSSL